MASEYADINSDCWSTSFINETSFFLEEHDSKKNTKDIKEIIIEFLIIQKTINIFKLLKKFMQ